MAWPAALKAPLAAKVKKMYAAERAGIVRVSSMMVDLDVTWKMPKCPFNRAIGSSVEDRVHCIFKHATRLSDMFCQWDEDEICQDEEGHKATRGIDAAWCVNTRIIGY